MLSVVSEAPVSEQGIIDVEIKIYEQQNEYQTIRLQFLLNIGGDAPEQAAEDDEE
jgi:hypothetical protein